MKCNVCGRELIRSDEMSIGACVVCMNEDAVENVELQRDLHAFVEKADVLADVLAANQDKKAT